MSNQCTFSHSCLSQEELVYVYVIVCMCGVYVVLLACIGCFLTYSELLLGEGVDL